MNKISAVKKLFILMFALLPVTTALADGDMPIDFEKLPVPAKEFVKKYFPELKVALATVDKEFLDTTYDVIFTDGTKIEFSSSGEWRDVDCKYSRVPDGVIPAQIAAFIRQNHADTHVTEIDRDRQGYDVNLNNRFELNFNSKGEFRGYDD